MKMINQNPQLSPKAGYVEVEVNGKREYRPTQETKFEQAKLEELGQWISDVELNHLEAEVQRTELELQALEGGAL